MKKRIENLDITKLIFNAATFSLCGWFIFVLIEIIMRLIKGPSPWPVMIFFTLLLYIVIGIIVGSILGGVIGFLLKVVKKWQQRIEAIPLIMACCIAMIMLLYTGLLIHDLFLSLYPHLSPVLVSLVLASFSLILLSTLYVIFIRIVDKTRLLTSYLALSFTCYAFMVSGFYINECVLPGKFFNLDSVRIFTNSGILAGSVILYVMIYNIFIFIGKKVGKTLKAVPVKVLIVITILLLVGGGVPLYITTRSPSTKPMGTPSGQAENKPNIILITMDTTRADHLSCYGYHKNTTPNLDKVAQESVVFKNAYAPSPWTLPSHASIFTGMYPAQHGANYRWGIVGCEWPAVLGKHNKTLAEILAEHGYKTAGIIGGPWCVSSMGLAQGFEYYDEALISVLPDLKEFTLLKILSRWVPLEDSAVRHGLNKSRTAFQINTRIFSWLEKHYGTPFFLFINYFDPHGPYLPPDEYFLIFRDDETGGITESKRHKRDLLACYDGEIAYLDYQMGKLFEKLKKLNLYDNTIIIVTSDHGEFFGEHGYWTHGFELYDEVIKVPLIIKYPSSYPKKGVYPGRVSLVDIMPTILNFLNLPLPKNLQGVDMVGSESRVMAEVYRHKNEKFKNGNEPVRELKLLFLDNYKYIKEYTKESKGQEELYDMENDPQELYNLVDKMPEKAKEMEMKLAEWLTDGEYRPSTIEPVKIDQATKEGLKALGYIR